jgi:hypothetical protein
VSHKKAHKAQKAQKGFWRLAIQSILISDSSFVPFVLFVPFVA